MPRISLSRIPLLAVGPTLAVLLLTGLPATAGAENLACQTVNGKTTCMTGPGVLTCETVNGNTTCRRGAPPQDLKPLPPSLPMPPLYPQTHPTPDTPFGRNFPFEEEA